MATKSCSFSRLTRDVIGVVPSGKLFPGRGLLSSRWGGGRVTGCYQAGRRTLCAGKFQKASLARARCMREHARDR